MSLARGNKRTRREPLVCEKHSKRRANVIRAHGCFQNLPNLFSVISTYVISLQSPCNPITFYRVDAHNIPATRILLLPLDVRDSSAMAFGLFRVDYISRLVLV